MLSVQSRMITVNVVDYEMSLKANLLVPCCTVPYTHLLPDLLWPTNHSVKITVLSISTDVR